jgi:hypothetical protein
MTVTDQNQDHEDSLRVTENDDGTFSIEWDPCDSKWSVLNHMTSEEISAMIMEYIKDYIKDVQDGYEQ